jgi:hypothetical protein
MVGSVSITTITEEINPSFNTHRFGQDPQNPRNSIPKPQLKSKDRATRFGQQQQLKYPQNTKFNPSFQDKIYR